MNSRIMIRTSDEQDFFAAAKDAARCADRGEGWQAASAGHQTLPWLASAGVIRPSVRTRT